MSESTVMKLQLPIKGVNELQESTAREVDIFIDEIISKHKGNANAINMLLLDSVTMLSVAEARSDELASQSFAKKMWNGLTGKNQKIRAEIDENLASAQYASQQMIQKLAEQNLLTFELITTVNNKLNTMMTEVEEEINRIYGTLVTFFKQIRSNLIQLESRVEKLEQNVNLLHWHNTIEYQMLDGKEYSTLPEVEKFLCLANDFYHLTKGQWTTADLMLLKSTMSEVGIDVKREIQYRTFLEYIVTHQSATLKMLDGKNIELANNLEPYQASLIKGVEKYTLLQGEERFVVDSVSAISSLEDSHEIKMSLLYHYLKDQAIFDIDKTVTAFDLMNEILVNMSLFFNAEKLQFGLIVQEEYEEKIRALQNVIDEQKIEIEENGINKLVGERVIVRYELSSIQLTMLKGVSNIKSILGTNVNENEKKYDYPIQWIKNDGDLVRENEVIALKTVNKDSSNNDVNNIKAPTKGRLYIVENSDKAVRHQIVAVIGNPKDNADSIRKWVESFKND